MSSRIQLFCLLPFYILLVLGCSSEQGLVATARLELGLQRVLYVHNLSERTLALPQTLIADCGSAELSRSLVRNGDTLLVDYSRFISDSGSNHLAMEVERVEVPPDSLTKLIVTDGCEVSCFVIVYPVLSDGGFSLRRWVVTLDNQGVNVDGIQITNLFIGGLAKD